MHLRLQDFKTISEYNSALFRISSQLKLCGEKVTEEDMQEKTFTTFQALNVLLWQQYRERRFKKYYELISCLLVAEQNNEFLMKNHQSRPTGTEPFPEVNAISSQTNGCGRGRGCVRVVEGILDSMELMVIILPIKGKLQCTTRSRIIQRQNMP